MVELIGGMLGVMLFATLISRLLQKIVSFNPMVLDAIAVEIFMFVAPALYAYSSGGRVDYWDHALMYWIGGVLALPLMWQMRRYKARKLTACR